MKCPTDKQISLLVDNELPESEAAALLTHVADCAQCRLAHQTMLSLNDSLGSFRPPMPTEDLARRVKARIAQEREKAAPAIALPLWARASLVAALVTFAVGLGNIAGNHVSQLFVEPPREHILELLVPGSTPGFTNVVMDLGPQEITR